MLENARLLCVAGPDAGRGYPIPGTPALIGRDPSARIRLSGGDVSRRHARVFRDGDVLLLEDLGSRNGTLVNGAPAERRALQRGDQIQIGANFLVFVPC